MNYFNNDPAQLYRNIKERIPSIKIKNKNFMDKLHNLNMSSDFWWVISGEYALLAEKANILSSGDPRFLNDLKKHSHTFPTHKKMTDAMMDSVVKDFILDRNFDQYSKIVREKNIDELLIDDEDKYFTNEIKTDEKIKIFYSMVGITNFLSKLRLKKFKYLYLKIKIKIRSIYTNTNKNTYDNDIFIADTLDNNFNKILKIILPDQIGEYFPKWFLWLSNYMVKSKHKWITYFGLELNIYQTILIAKSYEKYGAKNIKMIPHGLFMEISTWSMYRFSLFPDMKLNIIDNAYGLPKILKSNASEGILFCPAQLPFICGDFFSVAHFWQFMTVYTKAIKLLNNGLKNNKKIKIRYKNFTYLNGYVGPQIPEENNIPVEYQRFEEVYNKYKLIVSMPFGTISAKCHTNGVNCMTYQHVYYLTNKQSYLKLKTFPNVFTEADKFLHELEKKINEL